MSVNEQEARDPRVLWAIAGRFLSTACDAATAAQSALEDLGRSDYADQLQSPIDALRRAANEANEEAEATP